MNFQTSSREKRLNRPSGTLQPNKKQKKISVSHKNNSSSQSNNRQYQQNPSKPNTATQTQNVSSNQLLWRLNQLQNAQNSIWYFQYSQNTPESQQIQPPPYNLKVGKKRWIRQLSEWKEEVQSKIGWFSSKSNDSEHKLTLKSPLLELLESYDVALANLENFQRSSTS